MGQMRQESEQLFVVKPQFQNAVSFAPKNLRRVENVTVPPVQEPQNTKPPPNQPFPRNRGNRRRRSGRRSEQDDDIFRNPRPCTGKSELVIRETAREVIEPALPNGLFGNGGHAIEHESSSHCSTKDWTFPSRPGFGQLGTKCIVKANHFFAELPDKDLNHYDVTITPGVKTKAVNRAIIAELVKLFRESHLGMRLPAYDGSKRLYTAAELPFVRKEFNVKLIDEENNVNGLK